MKARRTQRLEHRYERLHSEPLDAVETELTRSSRGKAAKAIAALRFDKDYNRLLYASSFRKLGGITQVVTAGETATFHNRMTHSLKVAQTARLIGATLRRLAASKQIRANIETYGGLDPFVLDAACLAHDLGHPPFGHIGEAAIQDLLRKPSSFIPGFAGTFIQGDLGESEPAADLCFEGNAQSFRIVARLAVRETSLEERNPALNLTRATLAAQSKYPWTSDHPLRYTLNKWGAYSSEADVLDWAMQGIAERSVKVYGRKRDERRTIEAQVMDWADDVAYAVHDVEDFFRAGLVPLDALARQGREFNSFFDYAMERLWKDKFSTVMTKREVRDLFESQVRDALPTAPYIGSTGDRIAVHRFAKAVIKPATRHLEVDSKGVLVPASDMYVIIEVLKQLTWYYVIDRPSLSSAQRGQGQMLIELVRQLWQWAFEHYRGVLGRGVDDRTRGALKGSKLERSYQRLPPRLVDYIEIARLSSPANGRLGLQHMVLWGVVDYVVSLTEGQASMLHARLSGAGAQSMLESWIS